MKAKVLIVVPTLGKRIEMITFCFDSILKQIPKPTLVCVHPANVSNEFEILKRDYPDVIFEVAELPMIESLNFAFNKYSDHTFANWLGDDDLITKDCMTRNLELLELNPEIVGTFGGCNYIDVMGNKLATYNPPKFSRYLVGFIPAAIKLEGGLFKLDKLLEIGGIDPRFKYCPDMYVTIRLQRYGKWKKVKGHPVSSFRIHANSITAMDRRNSLKEARQIQMEFGTTMDKILVKFLGILIGELKILVFRIIELRNKK